MNFSIKAIGSDVLDQDIRDDVWTAPRAEAFLRNVEKLATAVQYVDSIIDPSGGARTRDVGVAEAFLTRLGRGIGGNETTQIIELRKAAQRFR